MAIAAKKKIMQPLTFLFLCLLIIHSFINIFICGRRCLAALNKSHKIQQNKIERIRGIVLKNIYTCDIDIYSSSEPSSNKLSEIYILEVIYAFSLESDSRPLYWWPSTLNIQLNAIQFRHFLTGSYLCVFISLTHVLYNIQYSPSYHTRPFIQYNPFQPWLPRFL